MPKTPVTDKDSLGYRLAHILGKLNQGEKLDPQALADDFNVNLRTIQRDLQLSKARRVLYPDHGEWLQSFQK